MKITQKGDKYLIVVSRDELLVVVYGLAGRVLLIRDIASVINPVGDKKKQKELDKLHKALADALPHDV